VTIQAAAKVVNSQDGCVGVLYSTNTIYGDKLTVKELGGSLN
jgi:hypothetical protein